MSLETLREMTPNYAKDIRLNLGSLANETVLTDQQKYGTFFASALASRNSKVIKALLAEAETHLSPEAIEGAKKAAAIMGMNNVYYRFLHLSSDDVYKTLPAKLRMNVLANPGVEIVDFELWSLAVSVINSCSFCVDSHEKKLRKADITTDQIQAAVRIAATVHAIAQILDGEDAMTE